MRIPIWFLVAAIAALTSSVLCQTSDFDPMFPAPPSGVVSGFVLDENGTSLPKARVILRDTSETQWWEVDRVETLGDGVFRFDSAPEGKCALMVLAKGKVPIFHHLDGPTTGIEIRLRQATSTVKGKVFLQATGEIVSSATVRLLLRTPGNDLVRGPKKFLIDFDRETDENGEFVFEHIPTGTFTLSAKKDALMEVPFPPEQPQFTLSENQTLSDIRIELFGGRSVRGRVLDKYTGKPVPDVQIEYDNWKNTEVPAAMTDADGQYRLQATSGSTSGICLLKITKEGWSVTGDMAKAPRVVKINADSDTAEIVADFEMMQYVTVRGRILGPDGSPFEGAWITAIGPGQPQTANRWENLSGPDGSYEAHVLPDAEVSLRVQSQNPTFWGMSEPIQVLRQTVEGVNITLCPLGSIAGIVEADDGQPMMETRISAGMRLGSASSGQVAYHHFDTDQTSSFEIGALPAGTYYLWAKNWDCIQKDPMVVELKQGEKRTGLRVPMKRGKFIAGKVIPGSTGETVGGANLYAWPGWNDKFCKLATTEPDGSFKIVGLEPGTYRVDVASSGSAVPIGSVPGVEAGSTGVIVEMGKGAPPTPTPAADGSTPVAYPQANYQFTGTVVDAKTSQPITDFSVIRPDSEQSEIVLGPEPGVFRMNWYYPNLGYLRINAAGYPPLRTEYLQFANGSTTAAVTFPIGRGVVVSGRFEVGGKPVAGARVCVYAGDVKFYGKITNAPAGRTVTDADGKFRIEKLPAGPVNIVAWLPASEDFVTRKLELGEEVDLDVGVLAAKDPMMLRGRVVHQSGSPEEESVRVEVQAGQTTGVQTTVSE